MWCGIVSLFPDMFKAITDYGITQRAVQRGLLTLQYWNPRDFAEDKHKTVDDRPFGGGPGMVMSVYPLRTAIQAAKASAQVTTKITEKIAGKINGKIAKEVTPSTLRSPRMKTIYVSPQGKKFTQQAAQELAQYDQLIFVAGRYEGVDERLIELEIDEEWSLGDYVITGGELAIMVMVDAITRLIPGALGHEESALQDSFAIPIGTTASTATTSATTTTTTAQRASRQEDAVAHATETKSGTHGTDRQLPLIASLLDCPHYTRPETIEGRSVPPVLTSGDHKAIARWRFKQRLGRTFLRRPDLLQPANLDKEHQMLLQEFLNEHKMQEDL